MNWSRKRGDGEAHKWLLAHADYAGDDCLIWPFARVTAGYGNFGYRGKVYRAHRFMCELIYGTAPSPDHETAHSCGRGHDGCVNPRHLSWKTRAENRADRFVHNRVPRWPRRVMLTPEQVAEIRSLEGKKPKQQIARMFGISATTVWQIMRGDTWKDGTAGKGGFAKKPYRKPSITA